MAQLLLVNPRRRKSRTKRRKSGGIVARTKTSISRRVSSLRRKYRRNPSPRQVMDQFKDGAIGALGALAVDVAIQKLPIPLNLKTGNMAPITNGLIGIGIGMLVAKFGKNPALGKQLAAGAVTVSLYTAGRRMLAPTLGLSLSGYSNDLLGYDDSLLGDDDGLGEYFDSGLSGDDDDDGLGEYFDSGMGYITGAPIIGE